MKIAVLGNSRFTVSFIKGLRKVVDNKLILISKILLLTNLLT